VTGFQANIIFSGSSVGALAYFGAVQEKKIKAPATDASAKPNMTRAQGNALPCFFSANNELEDFRRFPFAYTSEGGRRMGRLSDGAFLSICGAEGAGAFVSLVPLVLRCTLGGIALVPGSRVGGGGGAEGGVATAAVDSAAFMRCVITAAAGRFTTSGSSVTKIPELLSGRRNEPLGGGGGATRVVGNAETTRGVARMGGGVASSRSGCFSLCCFSSSA
jgi:hypothetical protein